MKAVIYRKFGNPDVLEFSEHWESIGIDEDHVLVKIHAGSVNPKDVMLRRGRFKWIARTPLPRVSGLDISGEVVEVGSHVNQFTMGDIVYGMSNKFAGGVHSEFARFTPNEIAVAPSNLTSIEAAAVPLAAQTAFQALKDHCNITPGQSVLINGASGGVGHFAVQIAKILGAKVHAICGPANIDFVSSLGADKVYDYSKTDLQQIPDSFNAVFDVFGNISRKQVAGNLIGNAPFVTTVPTPSVMLKQGMAVVGLTPSTQMVIVKSDTRQLSQIREWIEEGTLKPHIDEFYPADEAHKAHAHVESKHTRGKVVILFGEKTKVSDPL